MVRLFSEVTWDFHRNCKSISDNSKNAKCKFAFAPTHNYFGVVDDHRVQCPK